MIRYAGYEPETRGRPPINPVRRKSVNVTVRVTPAERTMVYEAARAMGVRPSDYVRARLLG